MHISVCVGNCVRTLYGCTPLGQECFPVCMVRVFMVRVCMVRVCMVRVFTVKCSRSKSF